MTQHHQRNCLLDALKTFLIAGEMPKCRITELCNNSCSLLRNSAQRWSLRYFERLLCDSLSKSVSVAWKLYRLLGAASRRKKFWQFQTETNIGPEGLRAPPGVLPGLSEGRPPRRSPCWPSAATGRRLHLSWDVPACPSSSCPARTGSRGPHVRTCLHRTWGPARPWDLRAPQWNGPWPSLPYAPVTRYCLIV